MRHRSSFLSQTPANNELDEAAVLDTGDLSDPIPPVVFSLPEAVTKSSSLNLHSRGKEGRQSVKACH